MEVSESKYYLGSNYNYSLDKSAYVVGCSTYLEEFIRKIEAHPKLGGTLFPH